MTVQRVEHGMGNCKSQHRNGLPFRWDLYCKKMLAGRNKANMPRCRRILGEKKQTLIVFLVTIYWKSLPIPSSSAASKYFILDNNYSRTSEA